MCISTTVYLSWFTLYKYICPDSSVLHFTLCLGQPEYLQLSFGFLSGARNRWRFCLSSYLFLSVQLFYFSSGIHKLLLIWDVYCICFQADIMYYVLRVCYSSFMNYYGIFISAASYSDISVSVILWLYFICSKFIYNVVFWAIQVRHVRMRMAENIGLL